MPKPVEDPLVELERRLLLLEQSLTAAAKGARSAAEMVRKVVETGGVLAPSDRPTRNGGNGENR